MDPLTEGPTPMETLKLYEFSYGETYEMGLYRASTIAYPLGIKLTDISWDNCYLDWRMGGRNK